MTNVEKRNLLDCQLEEFSGIVDSLGEKKYRAKQLTEWIYKKLAIDFQSMSSLPATFRERLNEEYQLAYPQIAKQLCSVDGSEKLLLTLPDKSNVEMVIIPAEKKNTLCISSQVGCARGCQFCATASLGLKRNLTAGEIVAQIMTAVRLLHENGQKLTNIVFMGMGEPLDNLASVIKTLKIIQHDSGLTFSPRKTTVSTCGIIPGIIKLADEGVKTKLAVSLNAALDDKRDAIMPVNKIYNLSELKKALKYFSTRNPFRITFEYVMIPEFNMTSSDVQAIKKFMGDLPSKLNLIAWNRVEGLSYQTPGQAEIDRFISQLQTISQAVTFRKSRGSDIKGACGQLAANL